MASRFAFGPLAAEFPSSNPAALSLINQRPILAFDASTSESAYWTGVAPQGLTGTITVIVHYIMASATTGTLIFQGALEAISPGDAVDLDAGTSFDTANSGTGNVPGTAGYEQAVSITMTNADAIAAGDYFRLSLARDISDTAAGDAYVLGVELRDGA